MFSIALPKRNNMAVKTKNYELTLEQKTHRTQQLFGSLQYLISQLALVSKPEALERLVREQIKKSLETYNSKVPNGDILHYGGGASHLWISRVTDNERVILIRFENEY